jgi:hypothetical protein
MKADPKPQLELKFDGQQAKDGLERWREQRRAAAMELAQNLGLPLNHPVEAWLRESATAVPAGSKTTRGGLTISNQIKWLPKAMWEREL